MPGAKHHLKDVHVCGQPEDGGQGAGVTDLGSPTRNAQRRMIAARPHRGKGLSCELVVHLGLQGGLADDGHAARLGNRPSRARERRLERE